MPAQPTPTAQAILSDTSRIRMDINTILKLAETVTVPMAGEASFIETVIGLLRLIVNGIDQTQQSVAALHERLEQPGIAAVLRRTMDED